MNATKASICKRCNHLPIKGFEWNYLISDTGGVFSLRSNRYLKLNKNQDGYYRFTVYNDPLKRDSKGKIQKRLKVHNTVAISFLGAKKGETIHHKDGNKLNNKASNLEIISHDKHSFLENRVLTDFEVLQVFNDYVIGFLTTAEICKKRELKYNVVINILASRKYKLSEIDPQIRDKAKTVLKLRRARISTETIKDKV